MRMNHFPVGRMALPPPTRLDNFQGNSRRDSLKTRCHCEGQRPVAISWYPVANLHNLPGDSQKVNCPVGAREATLGCGRCAPSE